MNLALNNPDEALNKLSLYSIDDKDDLITKINQTKQLRDEAIKKYEEKQTRQRDINAFNRAFGLWQAKESGAISDAEFFVLNADDKENLLWGMNEKRSSMPLVDAYKIVKKANAGENLSVDEISGSAGTSSTTGSSFLPKLRKLFIILTNKNTTNAVIRKLMTPVMNCPYNTSTPLIVKTYPEKSVVPPVTIAINGLINVSTKDFTNPVNADPMIIPIAMSNMFPLIANSLNSFKIFFIQYLSSSSILWHNECHLLLQIQYLQHNLPLLP